MPRGAVGSQREYRQADEAGDNAVHGERRQRVRLEVAHEELDRKPGCGSRGERTDDRLASDAVALVADELRQLQQRGGADDRSG